MKTHFYLILILGFLLTTVSLCIAQQPILSKPDFKFKNAPDTVLLTIDSAENRFLRTNLSLLAQKYSMSAIQALIIQARLYNNPNLQLGQGLYSGTPHKFFAFSGPAAEQSAQISQLIILAGKRKKQVAIATTNFDLASDNFYDLLRNLKFQLRNDFYTIFYNQESMRVYGQEIASLKTISKVFTAQLSKGYVAKKEVLRIQAQLFSLQNEIMALQQQILASQADLNLLLGERNRWYVPQADTGRLNRIKLGNFPLQNLIDTALANRYDLKASLASFQLGNQNYALQRSLAVPDLTAGLAYDRAGGLAVNYFGITFGIDIPLFNRNQGNIKNAKYQLSGYQVQLESQQRQVENEVMKAYYSAFQNENLSMQLDPAFAGDFERLINEVLKNYQRRNLGLLEFLDFYDSFKQNTLQINTLKLNKMNAYEQINFATGRDIFH